MPPSKPVEDFRPLPELPAGTSLIDSHCHLDMKVFDRDGEETITRAADHRVHTMITIGAGGSMRCNHAALALAREHANVWATIGVHPHDAATMDEATWAEVEELACHDEVVAVGETGLDFHYDHSPRPVQEEAFRRFIDMARRLARPVVVHLREADDTARRILHEERAGEVGGVIHSFSSDARAARAFLDLGFHLSFSGIVTFRNAESVRDAARITPSDRLMVETDAPFLAPDPFRGRRNEPALVARTAAALAEIRKEPLPVLAARSTTNATRLFSRIVPVTDSARG